MVPEVERKVDAMKDKSLPLGEKLRREEEDRARRKINQAKGWAKACMEHALEAIRVYAGDQALNSGSPSMTLGPSILPKALQANSSVAGWDELARLLKEEGFEADTDAEGRVHGCLVRWR